MVERIYNVVNPASGQPKPVLHTLNDQGIDLTSPQLGEGITKAYDRVNTALQEALEEAGIESPYPIQTVSLQVEPEMVDRLSRGWREHDGVA